MKLKFSSWIYRIAHNEAVNHIKKYNHQQVVPLETDDEIMNLIDVLADDVDIESDLKRKELHDLVNQILLMLSPDFREILILKYIEENSIKFATDSSNKDTKFLRNKVRLGLLPYLKKNYNEKIIDTLSQTAKNTADDYDFLVSKQETFWEINSEENKITFSAENFSEKHVSEQRLSLRTMIFDLLGHLQNIETGTIEEIRFLILSDKNKSQKMEFKSLKIVRKGDIITMFK